MYIEYIEWNPNERTQAIINVANAIIEQYQQEGYVLTLRQLYYQFVARDLIENSERSYKNLGNVVTKARMAGMMSWEAIEDRNRHHQTYLIEEDIMNPIRELPRQIQFDRWARQPVYIEVWVEKEALGNVIAKACDPYMVPHMACKGYLSASEAWRAGQRFAEHIEYGQECVLIHLGDHDPSGIDMTRDNSDRLDLFTMIPGGVGVERIALNYDQVEQYTPPPNPAKLSDTRAKSYISRFGSISWELDALEPSVLERLIQDTLKKYIDWEAWESVAQEEREEKQKLRKIYTHWDRLELYLNDQD